MKTSIRMKSLLMSCVLALSLPAWGAAEPSPVDAAPLRVRPTLGKRILWYGPNRVMDLLDIFRLRVRAGPGVSVNLRMTDYASFYWGPARHRLLQQ